MLGESHRRGIQGEEWSNIFLGFMYISHAALAELRVEVRPFGLSSRVVAIKVCSPKTR